MKSINLYTNIGIKQVLGWVQNIKMKLVERNQRLHLHARVCKFIQFEVKWQLNMKKKNQRVQSYTQSCDS